MACRTPEEEEDMRQESVLVQDMMLAGDEEGARRVSEEKFED